MPDVTLTISPALATRLATIVQEHNDRTSTSLTIAQWIILHLREVAIAEQLAADGETIQRQSQRDFQAALQAKKNQLMGQL